MLPDEPFFFAFRVVAPPIFAFVLDSQFFGAETPAERKSKVTQQECVLGPPYPVRAVGSVRRSAGVVE
jgi:hypothetical protein